MTDFIPKRKKLLTRPVFKWVVGATLHCLIETPMHIGKEIKSRTANADDKKKEPATLCDVINLATGEPGQIIANAIIKSTLDENYPDNSYVGKCFSITKQARQEGKQYDKFAIEEIENPNAQQTESETSSSQSSGTAQSHGASGSKRK